jgi:Domain of unknown function (DUF1922)
MICPRCNLETALDGSCDCPEQDRVPLPRTTFRRVNVRLEVLDLIAKPYANPSLDVKIALSGNPCRVPSCDYLAGDGFVCPTCVEEWEVHLGNVAALVEDLEVAARKQVKFGGRGGNPYTVPVRSAIDIDWTTERHIQPSHMARTDQPMPSDPRASYWLNRLHNELVGQVRLICDTNHIDVPKLGTTVAMSLWLLGQAGQLPVLPEQDGWGLVHDLGQVYRDCVDTIDAPKRHKYVRVCECGLSLWAKHDATTAKCACGHVYDVAAEHAARIDKARDRLVTIDEAATLSGAKRGTIRQWINRGRIEAQGKRWVEILRAEDVFVRREVAIVRYGDVANLLAAKEQTA